FRGARSNDRAQFGIIFNATALCRGALRLFLWTSVPCYVSDATALCRGSSRWLLICPPETTVKVHGTRPWHLQSLKRASTVETKVTDHGTRLWHLLQKLEVRVTEYFRIDHTDI